MIRKISVIFCASLLLANCVGYSQIPSARAVVEETKAVQSSADISGVPQIPLPVSNGEEVLRVFTGKSVVVKTPEPLKRVSVSDPAIATVISVAPDQILVNGIKAGNATLLLWDEQEQPRSFELQVRIDIRALQETIQQIFPNEKVQVSQSGSTLVIAGKVANQAVADRMLALAQTESATAANLLQIEPQPTATIMLQVRFAEVDRTAIQQLGVNLFSTGAGNTFGQTSTQQFSQLSASVGAVPANVQRGKDPQQANTTAGAIGNPLRDMPAVFGMSDLLNIFLFRSDVNLGMTIKALQQQNLLQVLAEPNLLATSGKEASFLAGGEFPFPVVQAGTGTSSVTIMFKEFGVRLKFTANLIENGNIRLRVAPEVSSLDFANALTISGFTVPALSTRRADTEVELKDGQSFAIAGLIDNRLNEIASKIPWLGDVPILGKFFRSRFKNKTNTELLVLVTPKLVKAIEPGQTIPLPEFPSAFMNKEAFKESIGEKPKPGVKK
jgi:pilus assembly protein CpaC